ncbi:MAG: hypothetical protein ACLFTQ_00530 [Candidatus Aenigmatarchaeota archaeon]
MKKGANVEIILALIAAFLLLGGGLLRDVSKEIPDEGRNVLKGIKDLFEEVIHPKVSVAREIDVEGEVTYEDTFDFKDINPESMTIEYSPPSTNITADGKEIAVDETKANLTVEGFRGSASIDPEEIKIKGEADSLRSGAVKIGKGNVGLSVKGGYDRALLRKTEIKELSLSPVSGSLQVDESISLDFDGNSAVLHAFLGDLEFEGSELRADGKVNRVSTNNRTIGKSSVS